MWISIKNATAGAEDRILSFWNYQKSLFRTKKHEIFFMQKIQVPFFSQNDVPYCISFTCFDKWNSFLAPSIFTTPMHKGQSQTKSNQ